MPGQSSSPIVRPGSLNPGSDLSRPPCYHAAVKILRALIILILLAGPAAAAEDPVAMTPSQKALMQDAYRGDLEAVKVIVSKGTSVNSADATHRTALMWAALRGQTAVVEFLHGKGADINAMDEDGQTALLYSARASFPGTVEYLLKNGADVNVRSKKFGITPLIAATAAGNVEIARLLLAHGADPSIKDNDGFVALDIARQYKFTPLIELLENPPGP